MPKMIFECSEEVTVYSEGDDIILKMEDKQIKIPLLMAGHMIGYMNNQFETIKEKKRKQNSLWNKISLKI